MRTDRKQFHPRRCSAISLPLRATYCMDCVTHELHHLSFQSSLQSIFLRSRIVKDSQIATRKKKKKSFVLYVERKIKYRFRNYPIRKQAKRVRKQRQRHDLLLLLRKTISMHAHEEERPGYLSTNKWEGGQKVRKASMDVKAGRRVVVCVSREGFRLPNACTILV